MNLRIVPLAIIASLVVSGCSASHAATSSKESPSTQASVKNATTPRCQSRSTVYVLPVGSGAAMNGTSAWMNLTMGAKAHGDTSSIETVIPSSPTWRVVRLTVRSSNADAAGALIRSDQAIGAMGTPIVSAQACFTGWNRALLSHLAAVTRTIWLEADRIANGMDFFGPSVVQPGQKLYVIVEQGSVDGDTYRQGTTGNTSWYAVNMTTEKRQFPVSLASTAVVGTRMLAVFVIPTDAPSGSYVLAFTGGTYPTYSGDFVFQVR